ncbi:MAG: Ldh family oxidoreductase, partial [Corynebacterium casei]|nr:Ldh family oxidoreductase [Corynebacterium casei]
QGKTSVGLTHFFDYNHGLDTGAINGKSEPSVSTAGAITRADAHRNIPHRAFHQAVGRLSSTVTRYGIGVLSIFDAFTAGELGYYTAELASRELVGLAAANSSAWVSIGESKQRILGTNPLSFAVPLKDRPLVIDQSITPSAFVSIREAAKNNTPLPNGWALNFEGLPTTDALEALEGVLLPAGHKLANVGLMVESLAGLAGGLWSLESPDFNKGGESPSIGVFIIAINPAFFGENYLERIDSHIQVLEREHGVYIPGRQREIKNDIEVDEQLYEQLLANTQEAELAPAQGVISLD